MDKHRAVVESVYAIEIEDLVRAFFVEPSASMQNEWQIGPALSEFAGEIWLKRGRVRPTKLRHHADRKPGVQYLLAQRVVMADGGYAAEQIADPSPP